MFYAASPLDVGACEGIISQTSKQLDFQEQLQTEHSEFILMKLFK